MLKKQKQRAARAFEEAAASGMVTIKGSGKKKRAERSAGLDAGLREDGGAFRGGVMRVRRGDDGVGGGGGGGRREPGGGKVRGGGRTKRGGGGGGGRGRR
jgi:hypothetical protein